MQTNLSERGEIGFCVGVLRKKGVSTTRSTIRFKGHLNKKVQLDKMEKFIKQFIRDTSLKVSTGYVKKGFVTCFLEIPLAFLGSMAAAVQPICLWNSQKTCYKTLSTTCRPRL